MKTHAKLSSIALTGVLGLLLAMPVSSIAADPAAKSLEQIAGEAASTPEQHQALADYYRKKADDARAEVTKHRHMANSFVSRSPNGQTAMRNHCAALSDAASKAATEYDAMAKLHDDEAKAATK